MDTAGIRSLYAYFVVVPCTLFLCTVVLCLAAAVSPVRAQGVELAFANFGQADEICTPVDTGGFSCVDVIGESLRTSAVVAARFDGDDYLDLVFSIDWEPNRICMGSSDGSFTCSSVSEDAYSSRDVTVADFNADGWMDVVFANLSQRNRICLGGGAGSFSCSDLSTHAQSSAGIVATDVNGDGLPDVAVNNFGQDDLVCLNDGAGGFTCVNPGTPVRKGQRIAAADLDRDGHVDLVMANQDQPNSACFGDGTGSFVCTDVDASSDPTFGVVAADLNGDDAIDLAFGNAGRPDTICMNDGHGGFTCSLVDDAVLFTLGVAAADVNADDRPDLVFAVRDGRNRVCHGDGSGAFACEDVGPGTESTVAVAAVVHASDNDAPDNVVVLDSDGDGVEDAIDECPGTIIPESVPTSRLLPNHFALVDGDAVFDTYSFGRAPRVSGGMTTADTHGCSCRQIIEATGAGKGHLKFGCTLGMLHYWKSAVRSAADHEASEDGPQADDDGAEHNLEHATVSGSNYPNPFNPSTTIRVELDDAGPLSVVVYDAMGREIKVLADGFYDAGVYEMTFRADHLPSGLYLYRLETSRTVVQRTMTLLK